MTITSVEKLSQLLSTTVATYGIDLKSEELKKALTSLKNNANFTSSQADQFISQYTLVDQLQNVAYNGFAAAVFEDKKTGKHVIAMRGTEVPIFPQQTWLDLVVADGSIGTNGFANNQAVEMFRYYKRLTTVGGESVKYTESEKWKLFVLANSVVAPLALIDPLLTPVLDGLFLAFKNKLDADKGVIVDGLAPGQSVLSPTEKVDVTGHSLGGHLAILFSRFFPQNTDEVVTLNAPGLFSQGDLTLNVLGFENLSENKITRVEADGDGVSEIGNLWFGSTIRIAQENKPGALAAITGNHSSVNGNDGMAVMAALARLDSSLANKAPALSNFIRAGSNKPEESYEKVLDALRSIILGPGQPKTLISDGASDPKRSDLYDNLSQLMGFDANRNPSGAFADLQGKIKITAEEVTDARKDFGQFLSLYYLTPFTVKVTDPQAEDILISAQGKLGVLWQEDKNLSATDRAAGKLNISDEYLIDRTAMLGWLRLRNSKDNTDTTMDGPNSLFKDLASKTDIRLGSIMTGDAQRQHFVFGAELNDLLNGGDVSDDLYGGAGNDTLDGGKGDDYLEGNDDNDQLTGGEGDDILLGGKGDDTYLFDGKFGKDIIYDSDEGGSIQIDGNVLTGGKKVTEGIWKGKINDVTYTYTELDDGAGGKNLYIKKEGSDGSNAITMKKWENKHLGINLEGPKPPETETGFDEVWRGDQDVIKNDTFIASMPAIHVIAGEGDDLIQTGMNAFLTATWGEGRNDWLEGGNGNDDLSSGWGDDTLDGGAGNDVLTAGDYHFQDTATTTGEFLHTSGSDNDVVNGGAGNDWITADTGNDLLNGDEGDDIIVDGTGRDTINGGDGDDWIFAVGGAMNVLKFGIQYGGGRDYVNRVFSFDIGSRYMQTDSNPDWRENFTLYAGKWPGSDTPKYIKDNFNPTYRIYTTGKDDYSEIALHEILTDKSGKEYDASNSLFSDREAIDEGSILDGGAGKDRILASNGNDIARGGDGDDYIWGRGGADILSGDDGKDTIYGDSSPAHYVGVLGGGSIDVWKVKSSMHGNDILDGGKGDDVLFGQGGNDTVLGGEGNDDIYGDDIFDQSTELSVHGNDSLDGGDGDDTITGGGRDDKLYGGKGNDVLWGDGYVANKQILEAAYNGRDYLDGGEGNDTLVGGGASDTLVGGTGNDSLYGDDAKTDMAKLGSSYGDDYLDGNEGDDIVDGGGGNDTVIGGKGDDTLYGDIGSESVSADNQGNDLLQGGEGDDYIIGDGGNDTLEGGLGIDMLQGGEGADTYRFSVGESQVILNKADSIDDTKGANTIEFGAGIGEADLHVAKADDGSMLLSYSSIDTIVIKGGFSGAIKTYKFADGHTISNTDLLKSYEGSMDISSDTENDTISGGLGNDKITANGGGATVTGGVGNDKITGRNGNNTYIFRQGDGADDILDAGLSSNGQTVVGGNRIVMGAGITAKDVKLTTAGGSLQLSLVTGDSIKLSATAIQNLQSSHALDKLEFADGSSLSYANLLAQGVDINQPTTVNGDKYLLGTSVNDRIYGTTGNDAMLAGAGSDVMYGGEADTMDGGEGDDTYLVTQHGDTPVHVLIKDGSGDTVLKLGDGFSITDFSVVGAVNDNVLQFKSGNNTITLQNGKASMGNISSISFSDGKVLNKEAIANLIPVLAVDGTPGNDQITAGDGNARIHGYAGDDLITGGRGDDLLWGDAGKDTLVGGIGDDRLFGGDGDDTVMGGAGNNVLGGDDGNDVLTDGAGKSVLMGGYGDDTLQGGAGDDFLSDDFGSDTYVFNLGDGKDSIVDGDYQWHDQLSADKIRFGAGIRPEALKVSVSENGRDLIIGYSGNDQITIFGGADGAIETYEFADGSTLTHQDLMMSRVEALNVNGDDGNNVLTGAKGNDLINALGGNDTLIGGAGDDTLQGGLGNDVYVYKLGDGVDTIIDADGDNIIRFAEGISISDLSATHLTRDDGDYLQISVGSHGDQILLKNGLSLANTSYQFADGTVFKHAQFLDMSANAMVLNGSDIDDILVGGKGNDVLDGGIGNDQLQGGHGMDTYILGVGGGQDVIREIDGESNLIALKDGVRLADLVVQRQGDNLFVGIGGHEDSLIVKNYFATASNWNIKGNNGELVSVASLLPATPAAPGGSGAVIGTYRDRYLSAHSKYMAVDINAGGTHSQTHFESGVRVTVTEKTTILGTVIKKTLSDAAEIIANDIEGNSETSVTSDVTTSKIFQIKVASILGSERVPLRAIALDELRKPGTDGFIAPANATPVYADKLDPTDGKVKKVLDSYLQYKNTQSVYSTAGKEVTQTVTERHIELDSKIGFVFEDIRAGASDNHIVLHGYQYGYQMIDAGEGDDFIDSGMTQFGPARESVKWKLFNPNKRDFDAEPSDVEAVYFVNNDGVSGNFLYGGAGNDTVLGTEGRDEIIGGAGNDFMNGGAQGDWYRLFANDDGWDTIYDSGYVESTHMQFPAEGSFDVDIDQSTIPKDTVIFEAGINLNDLQFSWGVFDAATPHQTLNISWAEGRGVRIVLANEEDGKNFGIENIEFADGRKISLDYLISMASPRPAMGKNHAPVASLPNFEQKIVEKKAFSFTVPAELFSDIDVGDYLTYSVSLKNGEALPGWLKFDAKTRTLSGTPDKAGDSDLSLKITAKDTGNLTASTGLTLKVITGAVNTAPEVKASLADQELVEKKNFSLVIPDSLFVDADKDDVLTYSATLADGKPLPDWLTFNADTKTLSGTPDHAAVGDLSLSLSVKDKGGLTAKTTLNLHVAEYVAPNTAPVAVKTLSDQAATEKAVFSYVIPAGTFIDADADDVLTYSVTQADGKPLPAWLTFNPGSKTLSGTPDDYAVGDLSLSISVKDKGGLTANTALNLHVAKYVAPNTAPVAAKVLADQTLTEKAAFSFALPAGAFTDADVGDVLTYSATMADGKPLPTWLTFNATTKTLSGTPDHAAVGDLSLSISVKDKGGLTAKTALNLHVAEYVAPNTAPVAAKVLADQSLTEKAAFSFALPAGAFTDADVGDVLTYSATMADGKPLPTWLVFDTQTKTLSGTPDHAAVGDLAVSISAKDKGGLLASSKLVLHIASAATGGLTGTDAADVLTGTAAADVMSGGAGADTLSGGAGNDSLTGGTGNDVLNGDAGDDHYYYAQGDGLDLITDTSGVDTLHFGTGLSLDNLIASVATVGNKKFAQVRAINAEGDASQGLDFEITLDAQGKVVSPIEKFMLSDGKQVSWDDLLVKQVTVNGGNAAEVVRGGRNDDTIFGVDGNDTIYGGYGNDKLDGGNGDDFAYGGVGNDRLYGQSGNDALYGEDGDDLLDGSSGNDTLDGGNGNDSLDGGDGIDILYGRAGDDKLTGGNGNDMLDGGDGNDNLDGGDYDDTLYGGNGDDIISAGYGNDYVSGGNGIDTITLANGNDVAQGGAGNDNITGDYGNKLVDGGDGDDTITMNVGNHWYAGGKGNDTIDPGQGLNVFAFNRGDGADIYKNNKVNGNTISLGKGIKYADLSLSKSGMDLILRLGQGDSITLKDWYANQGLRGVDRLQFITEGGDYDAASTDKTKNSKVEVFDFSKLVQKFDASLAATPSLNQWAVMTSMLDAHLYGSNTVAIGGDLSYQYGLNGNLTGIGLSVVQTSLGANDFNNNKGQTLHTRPQLETGALLLM